MELGQVAFFRIVATVKSWSHVCHDSPPTFVSIVDVGVAASPFPLFEVQVAASPDACVEVRVAASPDVQTALAWGPCAWTPKRLTKYHTDDV